jgi:alanine racemase
MVGIEGRAKRPCEATIDLDALRANAALARQLAGPRALIAVVKADAYGHGAAAVAHTLVASGCSGLAVLTVPEAVALRDAEIAAPVLVLAGARDDEEARAALAHRLTPVVHNRESLERVADAARRAEASVSVHVEVDTGMQRMGVSEDDAAAFLGEVADRENVSLGGVYTHFVSADEPELGRSLEQIASFRRVLAHARALGVEPGLVHADNSAALMAGKTLSEALPEAQAVRPGLMLYGVRPAPQLEADLQPVMTLRASVVSLRSVSAGETVGYGGTFRAPAATRIATLAMGYADGIPWSAGNRGLVWLAGARRPIVGRVSMDSIGVDVGSDARVAVGDEAVIFGASRGAGDAEGERGIRVEEAALAAGTLHYELLVRVGARVPRVLAGQSVSDECARPDGSD